MVEPLRVLWVGADAPELQGVLWTQAADIDAGEVALDTDPRLSAAVLRLSGPHDALRAFSRPDTPWARQAVLVWPRQDDPAQDESLYAAGVQDILGSELPAAGAWLIRRIRAAQSRKRVEQAAARAYATDPLTGLVNRQQLVEHLSHLLAVRAREPAPIGVVVLQVGRPQPVDAALAHDAAQLVRRKIGVRLRAGVRASDVVAALDGETFAVMLSSIDSPADAQAVASKLALALRHPFTVTGQSITVPVEVGYAVSPEDGTEPDPLIRRAAVRSAVTGLSERAAANDP